MWSRGQPLTLQGQKPREESAQRRRIQRRIPKTDSQARGEAVPVASAVRNFSGGLRSQESAHSLQVWGENVKPNLSNLESCRRRSRFLVHTFIIFSHGSWWSPSFSLRLNLF